MTSTKKAVANKTTKPRAKNPANKSVKVHKNTAGSWVYPKGDAVVTLLAQPKSLGSDQLVHYTALKAAFGNKKTMVCKDLEVILNKEAKGRRTLRRAGRAQGYTFVVK